MKFITFSVYIHEKYTKNVFLFRWASFQNFAAKKGHFGFKAYPYPYTIAHG